MVLVRWQAVQEDLVVDRLARAVSAAVVVVMPVAVPSAAAVVVVRVVAALVRKLLLATIFLQVVAVDHLTVVPTRSI